MPRRLLLEIALFAVALAGAGCQVPWNVPTRYVIRDIDPETFRSLRESLDRRRNPPLSYRTENGTEPGTYVMVVDNIRDMATLRSIQRTIIDLSRARKIPVQLTEATLLFQSIEGHARPTIYVRGLATPGARVFLDFGTGKIVPARAEADGYWMVPASQNPKLRERGGWVYGIVEKGGTRKYIKVNVLDADSSTNISETDIPLDSPLRYPERASYGEPATFRRTPATRPTERGYRYESGASQRAPYEK